MVTPRSPSLLCSYLFCNARGLSFSTPLAAGLLLKYPAGLFSLSQLEYLSLYHSIGIGDAVAASKPAVLYTIELRDGV